jgi:N-acetylglutamate synthase-like GNAT family acetyltransferase
VEENLISVVSVFLHGQEAQFRKFATVEQYQGKGYGSKLLQYVFDFLEEKKVSRIWCNARISKAGFYQKFGMETTAATFEKEGMEYVVMERVYKNSNFNFTSGKFILIFKLFYQKKQVVRSFSATVLDGPKKRIPFLNHLYKRL